jgi:hypothetical protein
MHAVISTWRVLDPGSTPAVAAEIADRLLAGGELRLPGHAAGFTVDSGDGRIALVNVYTDDDDADATADAVSLVVRGVLEGKAELIDRLEGAAIEIANV